MLALGYAWLSVLIFSKNFFLTGVFLMQCETIKTGTECNFMAKTGCAFSGGACRIILDKCEGCDRVLSLAGKSYCQTFPDPSVRWRLGNCSMATHIRGESKNDASKVRVGQQKQKKK
jgi:hypothetical protein